jgi:hypothetical protein
LGALCHKKYAHHNEATLSKLRIETVFLPIKRQKVRCYNISPIHPVSGTDIGVLQTPCSVIIENRDGFFARQAKKMRRYNISPIHPVSGTDIGVLQTQSSVIEEITEGQVASRHRYQMTA